MRLPLCGANDKQTYGKKTEKPRDSAEKSAPAPRLFHCEYFQNAARLILTTSTPFPAGRVFTGAACGGGSPMRKGVCYAMLFYAMCTKVHFLCIYGRFLQHLR